MSVGRSIGLEKLLVVELLVQYESGREQAGTRSTHVVDQ